MAGGFYNPFGLAGNLAYWTGPGGVVRIKGRKGFESENSWFASLYVKRVQEAVKETLNKTLPDTIRSFMNNSLEPWVNVPFDTGNLRDSMVAVIITKDENGNYRIPSTRIFKAPATAQEPQTWGLSLGGMERHLLRNYRGGEMYYRGYGRDYLMNYTERLTDPEEDEILIHGDMVIVLEATIPYSEILNNGEGPHDYYQGWFNDLSDLFINRIEGQVGLISADDVTKTGIGELGIRTQLAFDY